MNDLLHSVLYMTVGSLLGSFSGNMFFLLMKKTCLRPRPEYRCSACENCGRSAVCSAGVLFPCPYFERKYM